LLSGTLDGSFVSFMPQLLYCKEIVPSDPGQVAGGTDRSDSREAVGAETSLLQNGNES